MKSSFRKSPLLHLAAAAASWVIVSSGSYSLKSAFGRRDPSLDNKRDEDKPFAFKTNEVRSLPRCAGLCQRHDGCVSFFYNRETEECQGQETDLENRAQVDESPGTRYYRMYRQKDIRKTPKLIDAFNKQLFWDEDVKLTGIPDANVCVNKCEKEYPNCLVANYFEPLRNCLLFEKVHVTEENASKRLSGVYYRMQRSFCDEDEEYIANPNLNICYKYHLKKASWYEADLACKAEGAHMANVPSEEVKEFLEETVNSVHFFDTQIHVGISEQKNSGIYVDWKNQPVKSSLWDKEFSGHYDRNCVTLNCWHDCTWETKDCRSLKEFICVK